MGVLPGEWALLLGVFRRWHNTARGIVAESETFAWGVGGWFWAPFLGSAAEENGRVCYRGHLAVSRDSATV